ncbi:MAG: DUF1501 domain-containing protein [Chloroflexota bacterium]
MQKQTRRGFLKLGSVATLAAASAACSAPTSPAEPASPPPPVQPAPPKPAAKAPAPPPTVAAAPARAAAPVAAPSTARAPGDRRILVVVQMGGGDDGLNTLVPYGNGLYYQARPQVSIPADQLLRLNDQFGLHPSLKAFKELYDGGKLAFVQGVGYPNPSRSHFRSMDIWHSARLDGGADEGWLGAFMSEVYKVGDSPFQCVNIGNSVPKALLGANVPAAAVQDTGTFAFVADRRLPAGKDPLLKTFGEMYARPSRKLPSLELVSNTWGNTVKAVDLLAGSASKYQSTAQYPNGPFGKTLQQVAQMIGADLGTRVFYVSLGGFDTHANQKQAHANLLSQVSDGVTALYRELEQMGKADRVMIVGFSEFGRRVRENGSNGTDHGAAGPMFVLGAGVKGGLYGDHPSLTDLDEGDLKYTVDFRQVYATILDGWFEVPSKKILGGSFDRLGFVG